MCEDSKWRFKPDLEEKELDAANQLSNIYWHAASDRADETSVPGAVATAFIKGSTLQRIKHPGVEAYSQLLFNEKRDVDNEEPYPCHELGLTLKKEDFYSLLKPSDLEDLLAIWLYDTKGYVCIPSSNKIATPKYECVLVDPSDQNRKHIYIQVKNGKVNLDANEYSKLEGEVYLLTTEGTVSNIEKYPNIFKVEANEIFEFAINPANSHIIPENVLYWIEFLSIKKGIMFDTNLSYSSSNELEMLSQNKIAAYGNAKRFIDSFGKGDYALFYSKGKGIIAVGEITSDKATDEDDERFHTVKMIVPKEFDGDINKLQALSRSEIKNLLKRDFYWASTIKTPFLNKAQTEILIQSLEKKYANNGE
ncbi:MAG: hypothetical protein K6G50_09150 [bacterium]|nr:hypothetical protein [bacterium]